MACKEYTYRLNAAFHIRTTPTFHLETIFLMDAMACKPIITDQLKQKLHSVLSGIYSTAKCNKCLELFVLTW